MALRFWHNRCVSRRAESEPTDPIEELRREDAQLRQDLEKSEAERARLDRERTRLKRENTRLKEALETARRAGARQAAPFSKGSPKRRPRRPGRKTGTAHGRHGQRPVPAAVQEAFDVPLPAACPTCGDVVHETHVAAQYQEDLPPVQPVVRRFDVHVGRCHGCARRVQGRHRLQTSDALGAAAVRCDGYTLTA